jgi:hypothetical protein
MIIAQVIMAIFVAVNIMRAWFRFGQLTLQLLTAYSRVESEEGQRTLVAHFLIEVIQAFEKKDSAS